jgi:hypothetical protein
MFQFCSAQEIVTDTVNINFITDSLIPANYYWKNAIDNRNAGPRLVSYSQKRKYVLIPVDQELCVQNPLSEILAKNRGATFAKDTFVMEIDYFLIERYKGRFINPYILYADLPVKKLINGNEEYIGTFSYNYEYKPFVKKTTYNKACEELLEDWHQQFKIDMISVSEYSKNHIDKPANLLSEPLKKPYFFNLTIASVAGLNFWQVDGEIHFTRPETNTNQWFTGSIVRYQNTPDFEMVGFGKKSEHFYKRIKDNATLDISSNILLGLNKWRNTEDIKLYQILQISISSAQSINFDKLNQSGFLLKAGLFENFYYIVEKGLFFQIGPYLSLGYKF